MTGQQKPTLGQHENGVWYIREGGTVLEAYWSEFDALHAYDRVLRTHEYLERLSER